MGLDDMRFHSVILGIHWLVRWDAVSYKSADKQLVSHLIAASSCAAMSKSMLVERLKEAEDRLLTSRQDEVMAILVRTKIKLAQADYVNLELTVRGQIHSLLLVPLKS